MSDGRDDRGGDQELRGERVVLRPLRAEDGAELRRIRDTPEVARWWGPLEDDFPDSDEPEATRFTIFVDGEVAGMVQYSEEKEPDYRYAEIDIYLDPRHHGRGLGADALRAVARHLREDRGHHRLAIVPRADNAVAIRSYEKAGFQPVGVMRASGRDPATGIWHDELLMELVVLPERYEPSRSAAAR